MKAFTLHLLWNNKKINLKCTRKGAGFTLTETIIAIAIFIVVILAITVFIFYFYKTNIYNFQQISAINSARRGMETVVREIRETTYSDTGSYPVVEAQDQSFTFYSDIDKDEKVERIRYFLDGSDLKRGELEATGDSPKYEDENEIVTVLSDKVRNGEGDVFTYYDKDNNEVEELEEITAIRLVEISLIVNIDPNRPPDEFTLKSSAQLRNLKEE